MFLTGGRTGLNLDGVFRRGNPSGTPLFPLLIERQEQLDYRPPRQVSADGDFASQENLGQAKKGFRIYYEMIRFRHSGIYRVRAVFLRRLEHGHDVFPFAPRMDGVGGRKNVPSAGSRLPDRLFHDIDHFFLRCEG